MARSLNRVQLIGNLTRDPELRYTPQGTAVCSFGLATNRNWTTDTGEKRDEAEFHKIVAWNKLAEICSQFLTKGKKTYVEGRLSTRSWTAQDGTQKQSTEIIISDMILLDSFGKRAEESLESDAEVSPKESSVKAEDGQAEKKSKSKKSEKEEEKEGDVGKSAATSNDEVAPDDIPF